jgi:glycosyltransferase EpsD
MKKVLLVATVQSHIAQFHKPLIGWLCENGYQVDIAAKNNLALKPNLHLDIQGTKFDIPFERSPFSLRNVKAYLQLKKVIQNGDYDIVHCNTPVGGILTRLAANKKRKKGELKVIYEAHGFHFYKGGPKKNWLLWYPIEKLFAHLTDVLVTINREDYTLAVEKMKAKRIAYVPGVGLDLSRFENADGNMDLRAEFGLPTCAKVVISVGELNRNKNQQVIIRALAHLKDPNIHYFLVGNGPMDGELRQLSKELDVAAQVHFLGYRRDVPALLKNADVYAFPSLREGLGMASIEAMASGLPLVTSDRHGINDYSEDGVTGYKYAPKDHCGFAEGIRRIAYDDALKHQMGEHNKTASKQFTVDAAVNSISQLYGNLRGV